MMLKKESDAGDTEKVLRFRAASVFDIAQTEGDDLPANRPQCRVTRTPRCRLCSLTRIPLASPWISVTSVERTE
jgi:hypothetical protein